MDTEGDPRFAVLERAILDLQGVFDRGHLKAQFPRAEASDVAERAHGALMELRYTYAEPDAIRGMDAYATLVDAADEIEDLLGGPDFVERIDEPALWVARTRWALAQLRSFGDRLDLDGGWETAVHAAVGRVLSGQPHPDADNLQVTRVTAGRSIPVVTNDLAVGSDDRVGVAFLPPVELRGVLSEGMFLGAEDGVLTGVDPHDDGRPDVPDDAWAETQGLLAAYADEE